MGTNTLSARSAGQTVEADDVNQYRNAFMGDHVPRNASGSAEDQQGSLGTSSLQWLNIYFAGNLVQNGEVIDLSQLTSEGHQILSGNAASSGYPTFLSAVGGAATGRILGTTTALSLIVNTASVTVSADIDVTGLSLGPAANNTCLVNDASLAGEDSTKTLGERGEALAIDTIGTEISTLNGTIQAFKKGAEYFLAYIDTANNRLFPFMRGVCRTDREALTNNDTLTLVQANHIFIDTDGATTYKTTLFPTFQPSDPASPTSNQFYFDTTNKRWRRYSGSWANIDAHWLGFVICDDTQAVAAHSNDFDLAWGSDLTGRMEKIDADTVRVILNRISVSGREFSPLGYGQTIQLSVSGDRESGVTESASKTYYVYCDKNLKLRFSDKAPRPADHREGQYHPSEYWRFVGTVENDGSSNISTVTFVDEESDLAYPKGFMTGPAVGYVSASSIKIPEGFRCRDADDSVNIEFSADATIDITTSGANGLDTGSEAANTWYYAYAISNDDGSQVAGLLSAANVAGGGSITLPSGYTKYRQLPIAVRNNASSNFLAFQVGEGWPYRPFIAFDVTSTSNSGTPSAGATNMLAAGTATSFTTVSLGSYCPPISKRAYLNIIEGTNASWGYFQLRPNGSTSALSTNIGNSTSLLLTLETNSSQQIQYRRYSGSGSLYIDVMGFIVTEVF